MPKELKNAIDIKNYYNVPEDRMIKLTDPVSIESLNSTIFRPVWKIMLGPGKRYRAVYTLLLAKLLKVDWENDQKEFKLLMDIASLIETIHIAQLVLDDISDGSEERRDVPCLHIQHSVGTALNAGLQCTYQSYRRFFELQPEAAQLCAKDYVESLANLFMGQCMKEYKEDDRNLNFSQDAEMLTAGSTAKLILNMIFKIYKGDPEVLEELILIHDKMFLIHQIKDDLSDMQKTQITGAKGLIGEDISNGKYTPMVIYSLKNADPATSKRLYEILRSNTRDQVILNEAIDILYKCGGVKYAEDIMYKLYDEVQVTIDGLKTKLDSKKYNLDAIEELRGYVYTLTQIYREAIDK